MIPLDDLKLRLSVTTADDDALLLAIEASAAEFFDGQTTRYWGAVEEHTEYLAGTGTPRLFLTDPPSAITSVSYRSHPGGDATALVEDDDDGWLLRGRQLIRAGGYVWDWGREWEVVYERGYAEGDHPADAIQAVAEIAGFLYQEENRTKIGLLSESLGDHRYSKPATYAFADGMLRALPTAARVIQRYGGGRRPMY